MPNRIQRVNSLIKNELSQVLLKEVDFSEDTLVTVTRVETSVDLNQSKVYISVIPEKETDNVFGILNKNVYVIQQKINERLRMKIVPRIKFEKERKTKEAARVEELLEEIKNEEEQA